VTLSLDDARELAACVARPDFELLHRRQRATGFCAHPVHLKGRIEVCDADGRRRTWSTVNEPDGVLRKACGNRREAVCPPCAERYRQDAYQLIAAGLKGGKGVPDTVSGHPMVFATLTAPSFGLVHTRVIGEHGKPRRCRPRRDAEICEHGVRLSCSKVHAEDDPCLGEPLCLACFDHDRALLWNNLLGELWRRTTIYLPRKLARRIGVTQKRLKRLLRASYVKVAEYQLRGLVHVHVVIRLDRAMPMYRADDVRPPGDRFTVELLEQALRAAAADVTVPVPDAVGGGYVTWGPQLDVQRIGESLDAKHCAGYLAKYATKATEQAGGVLHPVTERQVDALPVREHVREFLRRAFALDAELEGRRLAKTAHAFGYRGHCLTKSRRYSMTFKALREAREAFVHEQLLARSKDATQLAIAAGGERVVSMRFAGQGHFTTGQAVLAAQSAADAREQRRAAWEERSMAFSTGLTAMSRGDRDAVAVPAG
jgi:Replication initiator protein, pSAM2